MYEEKIIWHEITMRPLTAESGLYDLNMLIAQYEGGKDNAPD